MGEVKLYHPVDEDKAREYVDAVYIPSDDSLDEDQQQAEKDQQVATLLDGARANAAWRSSRTPEEQIGLSQQPFASDHTPDDPARTGEDDSA